jgi:hypothetical protein
MEVMNMFALPILLFAFLLPLVALAVVATAAFQLTSQHAANRVCNQ